MEILTLLIGACVMAALLWARERYLAFPGQKMSDYAGTGPALDIRRDLDGKILCEGVIYGPTGRVTSRFVADMNATWDGNVGRITEHFRYGDGSTQDRVWTLALGEDGEIKATAPDLKGEGYGWQAGPAVQLNYTIVLPKSSGGHALDVTDWMYQLDNGTIMNRSQFRKFGIKVAELVATMRKVPVDA